MERLDMLNLILPAATRLQMLALRLRDDKRGIETLEWAVVAAVVVVAAVLAYSAVENGISTFFNNVNSAFTTAGSGLAL
jgi:Flp pilus assembly pilin Flp